jgi:propanol-preferring alcohol dehydrogenase
MVSNCPVSKKLKESVVYVCDIKPKARALALQLGAVAAFDLIQMNQKIQQGFTVDITLDFVANAQSTELVTPNC